MIPYLDYSLRRLFDAEIQAWHGYEPLSKIFWGYGAFGSSVLITLYLLAADQNRVDIQQMLIVFFVAYTAWLLVALWRCASAVDLFWQMLVRSVVFVWGGNTLFVAFFLQIDLVERYLQG